MSRSVAERRALTELAAIYRKAESLFEGWSCARSGECCQLAKTGRQPYAWKLEWLRVRDVIGDRELSPRADGACPLLDAQGRCTIYADRPLGCRTFFCERGSGPRKVARGEVTGLMVRLEQAAQSLDPDESSPRPLVDWLRGAGDAT